LQAKDKTEIQLQLEVIGFGVDATDSWRYKKAFNMS
jgi:hypothetical protein